MRRVLVAGVGYTNLRDMSAGPLLAARLAAEAWPHGVEVHDLGYGAVHVAHDLQGLQEDQPYERAVVFGAVARGRVPGTVTCYRWDGVLPDAGAVQAQVAEAVTGAISLDALLIVGRQLGVLPDEVIVIELEPADDSWGPALTPAMERAMEVARRTIRDAVLAASPPGPPLPLGGPALDHSARTSVEPSA
jgi:hydrogenase maturation protease